MVQYNWAIIVFMSQKMEKKHKVGKQNLFMSGNMKMANGEYQESLATTTMHQAQSLPLLPEDRIKPSRHRIAGCLEPLTRMILSC